MTKNDNIYKSHFIVDVVLATLTLLCIGLSAWWLLKGDIHYDIDISRDFLVISEAIEAKKPFLIGPHSGIISGVFHGPLWYYLLIPVFILSQGNPIAIGWFWFFLSVLLVVLIYLVSLRLFDKKTSLLAALLYSANSIINPMDSLKQFFNPYGAVYIFPVYYFLFIRYLKTNSVFYLLWLLLFGGILIQFQMAFGGPVLLVSALLIIFVIFKNKQYKHLMAFLVLAIPLSTFILFDLRHSFLQTRSFVSYFISTKQNEISAISFILGRIRSICTDVFHMLIPGNIFAAFILSVIFFMTFIKYRLYKKIEYSLFIYLYFGFWMVIFVFKGWTGNYYWPFLPVLIILFSSMVKIVNKKIFTALYLLIVAWNIVVGIGKIHRFPKDVNRRGINSWAYNKGIAEFIYNDSESDFGYFIFTPDRWVYNQLYAIKYTQRFYPSIKSYPSEKKPITYLIVVDPPKDRPDIDPIGWRITDVGILKESNDCQRMDVVTICKYHLEIEETRIPQNPFMMDDTFFR